jgi:DNA-directed RNA polymerase specialized sigma24 family protein
MALPGRPENAAAWLFRVAHNIAIDAVRRNRFLGEKTDAIVAELSHSAAAAPTTPTWKSSFATTSCA